MTMSPNQAYRLGSMPWRVYRTRCRGRRDDEQPYYGEVIDLLEEWQAILSLIPSKPLIAEVRALRTSVDEEKAAHSAQQKYEVQQKLYQFVKHLEKNITPPEPPEPLSDHRQDSRDLILALIDKVEVTKVGQCLPEPLRDFYELGERVAECLFDRDDENTAMRIWNLAKSLGVLEWLTGKTAGTPLDPRMSIYRLVVKRLSEADDLFSTQAFPETAHTADGQGNDVAEIQTLFTKPFLTIEDVARILQVGEDTVERLIGSGQLAVSPINTQGKKAGRSMKRILRDTLEAYMKRNEITLPQIPSPVPRRKKKSDDRDEIDFIN